MTAAGCSCRPFCKPQSGFCLIMCRVFFFFFFPLNFASLFQERNKLFSCYRTVSETIPSLNQGDGQSTEYQGASI